VKGLLFVARRRVDDDEDLAADRGFITPTGILRGVADQGRHLAVRRYGVVTPLVSGATP